MKAARRAYGAGWSFRLLLALSLLGRVPTRGQIAQRDGLLVDDRADRGHDRRWRRTALRRGDARGIVTQEAGMLGLKRRRQVGLERRNRRGV